MTDTTPPPAREPGEAAGDPHVAALLAQEARERREPPEAMALRFGEGRKVVDTGTFYGRPAVFIADVKGDPGPVGAPVAEIEKGDLGTLQPGEVVMTFPTEEQARFVADAIMTRVSPAVLAHAQPAPGGWQPIASAPMLETVIVSDGGNVGEAALWSDDKWRWTGELLPITQPPIAWMPLPPPPSSEEIAQ